MKIYLAVIATVFGMLVAVSPAFGAEPITAKNWANHPDIIEIRSIYQKAKGEKDAGKLRKQQREFIYCEPYEDTLRVLYSDAKGKPRIYPFEGGSGDLAVQRELYYDEKGNLRFAFITAGAFNGTRIEHRIYLSAAGKRIWETQKLLEGPGYTFPGEWPEEELVRNPRQAFNAKNPSKEKRK